MYLGCYRDCYKPPGDNDCRPSAGYHRLFFPEGGTDLTMTVEKCRAACAIIKYADFDVFGRSEIWTIQKIRSIYFYEVILLDKSRIIPKQPVCSYLTKLAGAKTSEICVT